MIKLLKKIITQWEEVIEKTQEKFMIPGIAVGLLDKNGNSFTKGFGTLSITDTRVVNENSIFALASISKSTASAGLSMLVDEGRINWTDPVKLYLPDFALFDPFTTNEIQIRDLLIHNSGLPQVSGGTIWYDSLINRKEVVHRLRYLKPINSFRSSYAYQNICYLVAGEIIEVVTGETWDEFIYRRIFQPLGMKRTTTKLSDLPYFQNYTKPHTWLNEKIVEIPYRNHENVGAGAAINSSAGDWLKYLGLFLHDGLFNGNQILSPERIKEMWSPQTIIPDENVPSDLESLFNAYGMGWFLREYAGQKVVNHSGGVDGMRTQMCILPSSGIGFLIFTNLEPGYGLKAIYYSLLDLLIRNQISTDWITYYYDLQQQYFSNQKLEQNERQNKRISNSKPRFLLPAYCGVYFDPKVGNILVSHKLDQLRLDFEQSRCFHAKLSHWENDTFEILWDDPYIPKGLITFIFDDNGTPEQLILNQPNLLDVDFSELEIYWIKK